MKTFFENYNGPASEGSIGLQLKYRPCYPAQITATNPLPSFRVTVERIDGLGLEEGDAIYAMNRLLDQMRIRRRQELLGRSQADA